MLKTAIFPLGTMLIIITLMQPALADKNIIIDQASYNQTLTLNLGEKVNWQNSEQMAHTITSGSPRTGPNGIFDSGLMTFGKQFSYTFQEAGIYDIYCLVHPNEQMKIQVLLPVSQSRQEPIEEEPILTDLNQTATFPVQNQTESINNHTETIIDALKAEIRDLKAENTALKSKITQLQEIVLAQINVIMETIAKLQTITSS